MQSRTLHFISTTCINCTMRDQKILIMEEKVVSWTKAVQLAQYTGGCHLSWWYSYITFSNHSRKPNVNRKIKSKQLLFFNLLQQARTICSSYDSSWNPLIVHIFTVHTQVTHNFVLGEDANLSTNFKHSTSLILNISECLNYFTYHTICFYFFFSFNNKRTF